MLLTIISRIKNQKNLALEPCKNNCAIKVMFNTWYITNTVVKMLCVYNFCYFDAFSR